jgi:predicted DNA-binding transcriptional regulator YafY
MTADELAQELEVSSRTIYRDIEALAAAGVPVYGQAGWDGGFQLVDGYRTRLTGLTSAEAESLFLVGLPSAAADLGRRHAAAGARRKLLAALPADQRSTADALTRRLHIDVPGWYNASDTHASLPLIVDALWDQHRLDVVYRRWRKAREVTRTIEPHGLVLKAGRWYLIARNANRFRTYRVSNILEVERLDERFERDPNHDLAAYWRDALARFHRDRHTATAVVRLTSRGLDLTRDLLDPAIAEAVQNSTARDHDGWTTVTIPIESIDQVVPELLKLGPEVEALAPAALRRRMADVIDAMAGLYPHHPAPMPV